MKTVAGRFFIMLFISVFQSANVAYSIYAGLSSVNNAFAVTVLIFALYVTVQIGRDYFKSKGYFKTKGK